MIVVGLCCTLCLLAGCGNQLPTTGSGQPAPAPPEPANTTPMATKQPTPGSTPGTTATAGSTPTATANPTPTPTPIPTVVASPPAVVAPSNQVTLTVEKSHYTTGETINITIANGLTTSIYAYDHQSGCTILSLELQNADGSWQNQHACREGLVTRAVTMVAGKTQVISLAPTAGMINGEANWTKGVYRLVLNYASGLPDTGGMQPNMASSTGAAYSATFRVE